MGIRLPTPEIEGHAAIMHNNTPELARQLLQPENDELAYASMDQASDELVAKLRPLYEKQLAIQERILAGLAKNGKKIRRNAICPCGSGKKFKKCCLLKMKNPPIESENPTDEDSDQHRHDDAARTPSDGGDAA